MIYLADQIPKPRNELVQQLKDILNALYPAEEGGTPAAPTDPAESSAREVAAPAEVGSPAAPAAPTDMAETPASDVAAPTEVGIETGSDDGDDGVRMLGLLPFSKTWPAVLKQCMESYDPQYDYQSCWVKGGGFVIGFKEPWELEHVPAKCQFPLSVYVAVASEAPASSTDAPASSSDAPASTPGDAAGSHVDQMDTLPLESNDSNDWPPRPWIPKSSLRRWKPMESPQDN